MTTEHEDCPCDTTHSGRASVMRFMKSGRIGGRTVSKQCPHGVLFFDPCEDCDDDRWASDPSQHAFTAGTNNQQWCYFCDMPAEEHEDNETTIESGGRNEDRKV